MKEKTNKKRINSGQEAVEWWLIVTLISFVVMFALLNWGNAMDKLINTLNKSLNNVNTGINTTGT